jgi:hypothetical protein
MTDSSLFNRTCRRMNFGVTQLSMGTDTNLNAEFVRIHDRHRVAMRMRMARSVLGASVIRVFAPETKAGLQKALFAVPIDELLDVGQTGFRQWYEDQLEHVAVEIRIRNANNSRLLPGLKWGHSSKVLCLYLVGLVEHSRYFSDKDCRKIAKWLHIPIDGVIIDRLRKLGVQLPFRKIREIDTSDKFYSVQDQLHEAASKIGIPRIWFDDNWADRD